MIFKCNIISGARHSAAEEAAKEVALCGVASDEKKAERQSIDWPKGRASGKRLAAIQHFTKN